jgi:hypothetical protein
MVAEGLGCLCKLLGHNFNPIRAKSSSIHLKKNWYSSKKGNFQGILSNYSESEPEQQFGFAARPSRSRKKYFRLPNTAGICFE